MKIEEAFSELTESEEYKTISKQRDGQGSKYRSYSSRFKKRELGAGAIVEMLIAHGWEVTANKAVKGKKAKG